MDSILFSLNSVNTILKSANKIERSKAIPCENVSKLQWNYVCTSKDNRYIQKKVNLYAFIN